MPQNRSRVQQQSLCRAARREALAAMAIALLVLILDLFCLNVLGFSNNDGAYNEGNYRHIVLLTFLTFGNVYIEDAF